MARTRYRRAPKIEDQQRQRSFQDVDSDAGAAERHLINPIGAERHAELQVCQRADTAQRCGRRIRKPSQKPRLSWT